MCWHPVATVSPVEQASAQVARQSRGRPPGSGLRPRSTIRTQPHHFREGPRREVQLLLAVTVRPRDVWDSVAAEVYGMQFDVLPHVVHAHGVARVFDAAADRGRGFT